MKRNLLVVAIAATVASVANIGSVRADAHEAVAQPTTALGDSSWVPVQYGDNRGSQGRGRGGPEAILFSNPEFHGDRFVIDGDYMPDLANSGFNDRAQSLRVEHGYWIFCSDAQFRGQCRTFGPGSYAHLGWSLDNRVSSGRRISNRYPYSGQPNWGDRH
jgi:hypothetical protein